MSMYRFADTLTVYKIPNRKNCLPLLYNVCHPRRVYTDKSMKQSIYTPKHVAFLITIFNCCFTDATTFLFSW